MQRIQRDVTMLRQATTLAVAAATFGLVSGGLIGGPVGTALIRRHNAIGLTLEATSDKWLPALDLFAEVLLEPGFDREEIERELESLKASRTAVEKNA